MKEAPFRILIVEDEPSMQMGLADNLSFEGYRVEVAADGEQGLGLLLSRRYSLVVLDVMMPKMSGFDVLRSMRGKGLRTPVIMLTARGQELDRVLGLELGADDYIVKPFSLREFLARVRAVLRRTELQEGAPSDQVRIGRLLVDFASGRAWQGQDEVVLPHRELGLLRLLWQHEGEVVSREKILEEVWQYDDPPTSRTVDNFVMKLRQRVEPDPRAPRHLMSVHGLGYKLMLAGPARE